MTDQVRKRPIIKITRVWARTTMLRHQLTELSVKMQDIQAAYQASTAEVAVLEGRLTSLRVTREKLTSFWEADRHFTSAESNDQTEVDAPESAKTSIVPAAGSPAVLRILLGAQLRRLREAKRITVEDAGIQIRASPSKISRLEAGRVGFKDRDITDLLTRYGVTDEEEREALRALARRANTPGWWHDYSDILPPWFEAYVGLEEVATHMRAYEVQFIPGLLQTEDYARSIVLLGRDGVPAQEIERRVRLRMTRQAVLDRPDPPYIWVVIDEAALRRLVGGPAIMRGQLKHLAEMAQLRNVTIQVIPFQTGGHVTAGGPFSVLRFAELDLPDVVYLEQLTSALYLDKPAAVDSYLRVMEQLCIEAATPAASAEIIAALLED